MSKFTIYELDVTNQIAQLEDITTGDAQGIIEANEEKLNGLYLAKVSPELAAKIILNIA